MAILDEQLYLQTGLALARAQLLERVIVNALVAIEILPGQRENPIPSDEWEKKYDDYVEKKYRSTLGPLIKALRSIASVPQELERILEEALKARNKLIHHFFRNHADSIINARPSERAIRELVEAQRVFQAAEETLVDFMIPHYERYAVTPELKIALKQRKLARSKT